MMVVRVRIGSMLICTSTGYPGYLRAAVDSSGWRATSLGCSLTFQGWNRESQSRTATVVGTYLSTLALHIVGLPTEAPVCLGITSSRVFHIC